MTRTATKKKKAVAKKKTTRKRSRVVVRTRKRIIARKRKRTPPKRKRRRTPPPTTEYSVNVSYRKGSRQQSNAISFQMSVIGPPGKSKDEVINVLTDTIMNEGEDVPKGWKVKVVSWRDGQVPKEIPWSSLAIIAGEPTTRFRVE